MPMYEEYDIMTRDGNYKRWPDREYRDEDLKGKGEPSYSLEEFEKQQKASRRKYKNRDKDDYELQPWSPIMPRPRADSGSQLASASGNFDSGVVGRSNSSAGRMEGLGGRLKKRFSLKRK